MENFSELLLRPLENFWAGFVEFVPNLLAMLIIFIGGVAAAWVVRTVLAKVLSVMAFDTWCEKCGITAIIRKADIWRSPSEVFSRLVYWLLVIVFLMVALSALRLEAIDNLNAQFFQYLPSALSAFFILVAGYAIAGFVSRAALIAAVNSGYPYAKLVAQSVRLLIIVLTLAMAFEQLQIAPRITMAAFSIVFGGIVLAIAISLGVGGIETARKMIERGAEERPGESSEGGEGGGGEGGGPGGEGEKKDEGRDLEYL